MITVWNSFPSLDFPITPINGYFDLLMAERENHSNSDCRFCILRRRAGLKNYALEERLFQVWNHKSSGVELWSRSLQNTKFCCVGLRLASCFNARWQKENGPKFHGTPICLVRGTVGAGSAAAEAPSGLMYYSYSGESFRSRSERSSAALSRMSGRFRTFSCVSLASKAKAVKCAWKNKVHVV